MFLHVFILLVFLVLNNIFPGCTTVYFAFTYLRTSWLFPGFDIINKFAISICVHFLFEYKFSTPLTEYQIAGSYSKGMLNFIRNC